jgi:hypothetical protein
MRGQDPLQCIAVDPKSRTTDRLAASSAVRTCGSALEGSSIDAHPVRATNAEKTRKTTAAPKSVRPARFAHPPGLEQKRRGFTFRSLQQISDNILTGS